MQCVASTGNIVFRLGYYFYRTTNRENAVALLNVTLSQHQRFILTESGKTDLARARRKFQVNCFAACCLVSLDVFFLFSGKELVSFSTYFLPNKVHHCFNFLYHNFLQHNLIWFTVKYMFTLMIYLKFNLVAQCYSAFTVRYVTLNLPQYLNSIVAFPLCSNFRNAFTSLF